MLLNELKPAAGSKRPAKRIGRGHGSGWGKTAGKGHNGQKQRAGASISLYFEGGQMPLIRRIPKRGFSNSAFKKELAVVNLVDLVEKFNDGEVVSLETLIERGVLKNVKFIKKYLAEEEDGEVYEYISRQYTVVLKVIGNAELNKKLEFKVNKISDAAKKSIEAAGGTVELLPIKGYVRNEKKVASN